MIIKGKSVAGASRLAVHLTRVDENERVEIREIKGLASENLLDALQDMEALAAGTRAEKPFYHASINTLAGERLTDEQHLRAVEALEEKLGLSGQPRIIVVHVKKDREHCHVVWSRIDTERMRAISDSHNYRKHEEVARELEREFGLTRVQGAHAEREGVPRPSRTPSHAEMLQAQRTGLTPQQVTQQVTALWQRIDSGQALAAALSQAGYVLARGDRRDFVIIDSNCGIHSLARCIENVRVKDVRERMADLDPQGLPSVTQAKAIQRARQIERGEGVSKDVSPEATRITDTKGQEAGHALRSGGKGIGGILDGIAKIFEQGLGGNTSRPDPNAGEGGGAPKPKVDPSVQADAEQKSKQRQELLREFGRQIENEREAEFERQRQRSR